MDKVSAGHRKAVARRTLAMHPAALGVLGGMSYAEAYRIVFGVDLAERCAALIAEYGDQAAREFEAGGVCWELSRYGWTPAAMAEQVMA